MVLLHLRYLLGTERDIQNSVVTTELEVYIWEREFPDASCILKPVLEVGNACTFQNYL